MFTTGFRTVRPAIALLLLCAVLALGGCQSTAGPSRSPDSEVPPFNPTPGFEVARLVRIVDGDTIVVRLDGREERVRYIGVDTPEVDEFPDLAARATEANAILLGDGWLQFERDVSDRDRFGRLLRYVWVDGRMVNEELLRQGEAVVSTFPPDVGYVERFLAAQDEAQASGAGLWAQE